MKLTAHNWYMTSLFFYSEKYIFAIDIVDMKA